MPFTSQDHEKFMAAQANLRRYCLSLTRNTDSAKDLFQDVMLKALNAADNGGFLPGSNMGGWLSTIAYNAFAANYRKSKRMTYAGGNADAALMGEPARISVQASQLSHLEFEEVRVVIKQLPADMRDALIKISMGESYQNAAIATGVPSGTIKSRVCRARAKIQETIEAQSKRVTPQPPSPAQSAPPVALVDLFAPLAESVITKLLGKNNDETLTEKEVLDRLHAHKRSLRRAVLVVLGHDDTNSVRRSQLGRLACFMGHKFSPTLKDYLTVEAAAPQLGLTVAQCQRLYERFKAQYMDNNYVSVPPGNVIDFRMAFNIASDRVEGFVPEVQLSAIRRALPKFHLTPVG